VGGDVLRQLWLIRRQSAASRFLGENFTPRLASAYFARLIDSDCRHVFGDARSLRRLLALNPLSFACAIQNDDMKALDLFAAGLEVHLQFKPIVTLVARRTVTVPCSGATERRIAGNGPAVQSARMLV